MTATIKDYLPLAQDIYRNTYGAVTNLDPDKWQWALDSAKHIIDSAPELPPEDQVQTPYPSVINRVYEFIQEFKDMHDRAILDEDETVLAILPYLNKLAEGIEYLYQEDKWQWDQDWVDPEDIDTMMKLVILDVISDSEEITWSTEMLKDFGYDKIGGDIHDIGGSPG